MKSENQNPNLTNAATSLTKHEQATILLVSGILSNPHTIIESEEQYKEVVDRAYSLAETILNKF
jgi:hypothetical protein